MVSLPRPWLPGWLLPRQDHRQPVGILDEADVWTHIQRKQPGLVREQLPDGDLLLALLGELRPVGAHTLVVVEQAP